MKHNREFEIAWQGLKSGLTESEYTIGDDFMKEREGPEELHDWNAQVKLSFDKQNNFFRMHFDVSGSVVVPCDRCGDDFKLDLWDEFDLMIKLTGEVDEDNEIEDEADVVFIPRNETVIDIGEWIYEFLILSVPLQKVHPDDNEGNPGCNPVALKLLNQLSVTEETPEHNIWKGLEAFKEEENKEENNN